MFALVLLDPIIELFFAWWLEITVPPALPAVAFDPTIRGIVFALNHMCR